MKIKKMVIISVSIILIGLVLQILPSNLTGLSTLKGNYFPATIEVSPDIVVHGEAIKIKINSPYYTYRNKDIQYWIGNKIYFYNDNLRKGEKKVCANSQKCRGNYIIEYEIPSKLYTGSTWPTGKYKVQVYDYLNKKYVDDSLTLVDINDTRIICKDLGDNGNDIYHKGTTYSYLTGPQTKKEDVCNKNDYNSKELIEYYCCKSTDQNYKLDLGMCSKIETCKNKCKLGSCWN